MEFPELEKAMEAAGLTSLQRDVGRLVQRLLTSSVEERERSHRDPHLADAQNALGQAQAFMWAHERLEEALQRDLSAEQWALVRAAIRCA